MTIEKLKMSFDPNTIEHLGVQLYSTLPPVLSEIIANSHDADAKKVTIHLKDKGKGKEIIVSDNGDGMSFNEINKKFLRIGRNRRQEEKKEFTRKGRKIIGKKGIGKLSFFGIAGEIEIETTKDGKKNVFIMNWRDIKQSENEYSPKIIHRNKSCSRNLHGTVFTLRKLSRESDFDPEALAVTLSRTFIFDKTFKVIIQHNNSPEIEITNKKRYEGLIKEVEWAIPKDIKVKSKYKYRAQVKGYLMTTSTPIPSKSNMRGVTLFSRNKLVNLPEYFSDSTSSHFFSYLTGELNVDFIDDIKEDVISTHRQALRWGHPEMQSLRKYLRAVLNWLEQDWRKKRATIREKELSKKTGINIQGWFSTLPKEVKSKIEPIIQSLVKDAELPAEAQQKTVRFVHDIVPDYPRFHWRNLHPEVQKASRSYYINGDYYTAFSESVKRYIQLVKKKTKSTFTDHALLQNVFSDKTPKLSVTKKFKKPSGGKFANDTLDNITNGHRMLVIGIWTACRCPIAHEEVCDLRDSGLFTEADCLDALSLLSHLFYRLDNSVKIK